MRARAGTATRALRGGVAGRGRGPRWGWCSGARDAGGGECNPTRSSKVRHPQPRTRSRRFCRRSQNSQSRSKTSRSSQSIAGMVLRPTVYLLGRVSPGCWVVSSSYSPESTLNQRSGISLERCSSEKGKKLELVIPSGPKMFAWQYSSSDVLVTAWTSRPSHL